jgi:ATP-binding cassette subfamily B (MDR/TAP) protein 6
MGSSFEAEVQKNMKKEQEERANAFKDFWPKFKRMFPFVYPKDDQWLHLMIALTFVFVATGVYALCRYSPSLLP